MNVRAAAAEVIYQVVDQGQSLSSALPAAQQHIRERDQALLQEICYGVLRWLPKLEAITQQLMEKPLKGKQRVFHHLILVGLYQLGYMRIPAHAAVAETVNATKNLKKPQLRGLINAVLRNYQRQQASLDEQAQSHDAGRYGHPGWLLKLIQTSYPEQYEGILTANNTKAPMWLRVNRRHHSRDAYQALLNDAGIESAIHPQAPDALRLLSPCDVSKLPGFAEGWVSVQDAAAQLAVEYLQPQAGELILDCCAAPGGKTAHILEREPACDVVAIDCDDTRLARVHENLQRLNLQAQTLCADARYPSQWWQGAQFDRILLDAPCSATGVIRRHPDIKWLRRADDIAALAQLQAEIVDAMWQQLKPGGTLVYATCSITPQENCDQVTAFVARTADATLIDSDPQQPGRQILPGEDEMDGFYYAVIRKSP
ncbi:16S rRNA (cytosine(967)-C(5))-methyltransferase RsmB [Photobacterium sp. TY1-4]|uniref:16S rRNA (cytosine(967)-C(5))-methyltransferase RsmB n=1 Tax=Photobacterium sp. TY1-4 TaxID=2899122 RepID=UPI0021BE017F|nr:16S rRNA (cytosine(967)-C(5))-methyltransferase RsmB [Photobacterium sp. TY1-4]UXI01270.1 16S rRNA (cytosine(967)-C(5))-methyltransferase RsmB [Photobacterium sp. TY1-4]